MSTTKRTLDVHLRRRRGRRRRSLAASFTCLRMLVEQPSTKIASAEDERKEQVSATKMDRKRRANERPKWQLQRSRGSSIIAHLSPGFSGPTLVCRNGKRTMSMALISIALLLMGRCCLVAFASEPIDLIANRSLASSSPPSPSLSLASVAVQNDDDVDNSLGQRRRRHRSSRLTNRSSAIEAQVIDESAIDEKASSDWMMPVGSARTGNELVDNGSELSGTLSIESMQHRHRVYRRDSSSAVDDQFGAPAEQTDSSSALMQPSVADYDSYRASNDYVEPFVAPVISSKSSSTSRGAMGASGQKQERDLYAMRSASLSGPQSRSMSLLGAQSIANAMVVEQTEASGPMLSQSSSSSSKGSTSLTSQKMGPNFTREPPSHIHYLNSTDLVIPCQASGNPTPTIVSSAAVALFCYFRTCSSPLSLSLSRRTFHSLLELFE